MHLRGHMWILALVILGSGFVPGAGMASTELDAAKACHKAIAFKGKSYANKRRRLLLSCVDKLLKCELQLEREGTNPGSCRSTATRSCKARLGSQPDSSLSVAETKFHDSTVAACQAYPFTSAMTTRTIMDNTPGGGGLWFSNDTNCNTTTDRGPLVDCLRDEIDSKVEEVVGRVKPRAGMLLDNIGLGSEFEDLPRPPTTDVVVSLVPPNSGTGTLVVTPDPIAVPDGNAIKFTGDAVSLPCGGGMGNNGKLTIFISTASNPCTDPNALEQTIQQPYGSSEVAVFGPFDADQNYCVKLKDPGGMGGGCTITGSPSTVDYTPGGATPPTTPSAKLLACQTRFSRKVKSLARFTANKIHGCAEKVVRCKLASEIDTTDPASCLASAHTACMGAPAMITAKLAAAEDPLATGGIHHKCDLVDSFGDLRPFVGGLGFSNVNAGCSDKMNLNDLMGCVLGVPGATGTFGTKCSVERKVFIRDPRANDSLSDAAIMLDPATNFPCLGP